MTIYFDMDGTIADLYGVKNWLSYLENKNPHPFICAKPLVKPNILSLYLNQLQENGWHIGIISWLPKDSNQKYNEKVEVAKRNWLKKYFPGVEWNEIHIIEYGTPKSKVAEDTGFLFDDETQNLMDWYANGKGQSCYPNEILKMLRLLKNC